MVPGARLNASFAASAPHAGDLALVSQSGAIAAGMVEWAARRKVGFSAVVSLGDQVDVDLADCLDYFAVDRSTRAILLYVESVNDARKFMSAARAAARAKPVVVVKSGRHAQGARAAATHTGALAGSDEVYDAAFRRAGLLRVRGLDELFAAAETLGRIKPFDGKRLAILTNGGGIGVLAVDRLIDLGGTPRRYFARHAGALDRAMPPIWSRANPVDIAGDADAARYAAALEALLADPANDAVLVMNVPTALASPTQAAQSVVRVAREKHGSHGKPVLAVWLGADGAASEAFEGARIPHFADEVACGRRLHASRPLSRGAGRLDGDAAEPAGGIPARRRACARDRAGGAARRKGVARSDRSRCAAVRLCDPGRAGCARARPRRSRAAECAVAGGRADGRRQDPLARYRPQIRSRRRAAEPHQRAGGRRRGRRHPGAGQIAQGRTRGSPA